MEWISVKDKLPKFNERVLTYCLYPKREDGINQTSVGELTSSTTRKESVTNEWEDNNYNPLYVTHWMPLPEPPKE